MSVPIADPDVYTWDYPDNPLTPFPKRNQMQRAKYLEWITINVNAQVEAGLMSKRPIKDSDTVSYSLSHLVKIAGQYPDLHLAGCAIVKLKTDESPAGRLSETESDLPESEGVQEISFGELIKRHSGKWKRQYWMTLGMFFVHIFPRVRPGQKGFLPSIYRQHIQANGELVANGSSIAIELTERNYNNIAQANTANRDILEEMLETNEVEVESLLDESLQGHRTVMTCNERISRILTTIGSTYQCRTGS